ncbi:hypothetical protein AA313_de0201195 [Arthrobotrys entomopaga]|nr:hypothetical protein AA313_de0201195 [Arthrobotrys entomopaga]
MSKRTSDSKVKAPLSALAARRLRQQQLAAEAESAPSTPSTPNNQTPSVTPAVELTPVIASKDAPNGDPTGQQAGVSPSKPHETEAPEAPDLNNVILPRQISNFTQTDENYVQDASKAETTVKLRRGESLVVQGEFRMTVISGSVSIYGAILEAPSSLDIIASASQALPVIECSPKSKKRRVEKPSTGDNEYDVIFTLKSTRTGLSDIGRICPRFDNIWKPSLMCTTLKSEATESFAPILTSLQSTPILTIPPSWQSAITSLSSTKQSPKSIFIVGGKSVGKSTFSRYLLNNITTSQSSSRAIVYLDLDPGQPSFTPPCMLSLHRITSPVVSPSFAAFTSTEIIKQHHIGYTSPREDPKYYLRCARDLVHEYRRLVEGGEKLTLVVNTCGWIKGMGRELLQELVLICEPTDMAGLGDVDGVFAEIIPQAAVKNVRKHILEAAAAVSNSNSSNGTSIKNGGGNAQQQQQQFTPADLRMLQTIAYFHHLPKKPAAAAAQTVSFDFENHLTAVPPLLAGYKGAGKVIDGITVLDADITAEYAFTAINATIVAINLVKGDEKEHPVVEYLEGVYGSDDNVVPYIPSRQFDGTSGVLPTETTFTIGLAIVRGVDEERGQLQLLTPVSDGELNRWIEEGYRIVLTRGRDEMPVWLVWDWRRDVPLDKQRRRGTGSGSVGGVVVEKMPYLDFVVGGQVTGKGAKEWKVRRNIMRRSQHRR